MNLWCYLMKGEYFIFLKSLSKQKLWWNNVAIVAIARAQIIVEVGRLLMNLNRYCRLSY